GVPLTGTVTGIAANSTFQVTVTDNGVTNGYTAPVSLPARRSSDLIPSTDALALANGTATVSAQVTDANGNPSAIATQSVTVAETAAAQTTALPTPGHHVCSLRLAAAGGSPTATATAIAANSTCQVT